MTSAGRLLVPLLFGALVLTSLAAFAIVENERDHPQIVGQDRVTRSFAPGARGGPDRMLVRFTITRAEPHATIVVVDEQGDLAATLDADVPLADDETYHGNWDGTLASGEPAPSGRYRVRVRLGDLDRDLPLHSTELLPGSGSNQ